MALPFCTHWVRWDSAVPVTAWRSGCVKHRGDEMTMATQLSKGSTPRAPARRRVVARLWLTAERQVAEIEARLNAGGDPAMLERDAKTFALIARTVRDLVALDMEAEAHAKEKRRAHAFKSETSPGADGAQEESFSGRDIEDFRAELAQRLAALRAERTPEEPAGGTLPA